MADSVKTVGDPEAMRALAEQLLGRAELVAAAPNGATSSLASATFEGRAAERLRGSVSDARVQVNDAASRLREVAARLLVDATRVEGLNADLKREAEAAAREAAENTPKPTTPASGNAAPAISPAPAVQPTPTLTSPESTSEESA